MSLSTRENMGFNWGVIWSVMGALLLALFLVFLRRMVDNEEKLNMPMFYGESRACMYASHVSVCISNGLQLLACGDVIFGYRCQII